jgi:hypothetical protein
MPDEPSPIPDRPLTAGLATATDIAPASVRRPNPYVGPRPFHAGELFFGREREAASLADALLASKIVLLHSPSGAGKTSLIQTSVVPAFEALDFQICAVSKPEFSGLRVKVPPPPGVTVPNRYVYSVVCGLTGHNVPAGDTLSMTLEEALTLFGRGRDPDGRQLIIIDQFEEILTVAPGDLDSKTEFFRQLGEALDDSRRWALLAMREDYMGGLDRFRRYLPRQLRSTFRLDLLDEPEALRAIQEPARKSGVEFGDDAARILVDALRQVHTGAGGEPTATETSPYIEPVLLQVLCYNLFRRYSKRGSEFTSITCEDVRSFQPFEKALAKYYASAIRAAAGKGNTDDQSALRDWIDRELITRQGLRKQTISRPKVADPGTALSTLQERHLIRDDPRPGGTWWELSHDMLAGPARDDNRRWRADHSEVWQAAAEEWQRFGYDSSFLLRSRAYLSAPPAHRRSELTENEQAFLRESKAAYLSESKLNAIRAQRGFIAALFTVSLFANMILGVVVVWLLLIRG